MNNQEIIEEYIEFYAHSKQSQAMRKSSLNYFFGKKNYNFEGNIFDITTKDLRNYFTWLKNKEGINLTTKKGQLSILSSFLNYLMEDPENDFLVVIPSKRVNWNGTSLKTDRSNKDVYATKEELRKILEYFKLRKINRYLIFKLFVFTGMRKGELLNLRIDEIDIKERVIHLYLGKTGEKYYILPNEKEFLTILQMYIDGRKNRECEYDHLFLSPQDKPYSQRAFNLTLSKVRKELEIENTITCHTFRRSLNDFRKKIGCPLEDRELLIGHKTSNVNINGYTKTDIINQREAYDTWNPYKDLTI